MKRASVLSVVPAGDARYPSPFKRSAHTMALALHLLRMVSCCRDPDAVGSGQCLRRSGLALRCVHLLRHLLAVPLVRSPPPPSGGAQLLLIVLVRAALDLIENKQGHTWSVITAIGRLAQPLSSWWCALKCACSCAGTRVGPAVRAADEL